MYFKLSASQEDYLLNQPETGMGYQVVEVIKAGSYTREKFLVLNSEVVIEMNTSLNDNVRKVINEGIYSIKANANYITLNAMSVFNEKQFSNIVSESKIENEGGAIENPVVNANGEEIFVRLSAFDNDRRVDKINKCFAPGQLHRGTVQPANGKRGGGKEAFFAKGTTAGTFLKQTSY